MKKIFHLQLALLGLLLLSISILTNAYSEKLDGGWTNYSGAWFEIKYPSDFKVKPSIRSSSASQGYDSVFFLSPDDSVEFYVFSPQWNGNPVDIEIKPNTEEFVAQKEEKRNKRIVRFATIHAKDKSYIRSYVDAENTDLNTRLVFGIRYTSQKTYDKYKQLYLDFKASIRQYGD
jgi:hypothetical protein